MLQTKNHDKKTVSPMVAGVAGAVVGAGVAVAGAIAMKDEKNRAKVQGVLKKVKTQALEYAQNLQGEAQSKQDEVKGKLATGTKEVKKAITSTQKAVKKAE